MQKKEYNTSANDSFIGYIWAVWLHSIVFIVIIALQGFKITHLSWSMMITYIICITLVMITSIIMLGIKALKE